MAEWYLLNGKRLKVLTAKPKIIFNIMKEEYDAVSNTQKRKLLCHLEDILEEFHECVVFLDDRLLLTDRWVI
jgi:hypothetical protein